VPTWRNIPKKVRRNIGFDQYGIPIVVVGVLCVIMAGVFLLQIMAVWGSLPPIDTTSPKEQYEIAKLAAEIRQIRSDTSGSLFWLKMVALFVTVGGAVGGYLAGQRHTTRKRLEFESQKNVERLEFENRKNVDSAYQGIVLELADKSKLLRAAAAVKLGMILKSFPTEWKVSDVRKEQLIQLTKQVLAAALSVEKDRKVLKTLTIALVLHKPWENDPEFPDKKKYADGRNLDLSGANAADAYWARVDFSYSDFYRSDLTDASFRESLLEVAQFRNAKLQRAVLANANCRKTSFKLADLRDADLTEANLLETSFEGAKVFGCVLQGVKWGKNPDTMVDNSPAGDGSEMIPLNQWLPQPVTESQVSKNH
jgi:hypothetical protein